MRNEGKTISRYAMILAVVILIGSNLFHIVVKSHIPTFEEQKSLVLFCSGIVLFFSPIFLSVWLERIFGKKKGGEE